MLGSSVKERHKEGDILLVHPQSRESRLLCVLQWSSKIHRKPCTSLKTCFAQHSETPHLLPPRGTPTYLSFLWHDRHSLEETAYLSGLCFLNSISPHLNPVRLLSGEVSYPWLLLVLFVLSPNRTLWSLDKIWKHSVRVPVWLPGRIGLHAFPSRCAEYASVSFWTEEKMK